MLHLHAAPTLEALAAAWCDAVLAAEATAANPFAPLPLVAPDPGVVNVLVLALARRRGVAANVRPSTSLAATLAGLSGVAGPEREGLLRRLLDALEDVAAGPADGDPALAPLRAWLTLDDAGDAAGVAVLGPAARADARAARQVALALRLARRLEAYALDPGGEPLAAWRVGRPAAVAPERREVEAWQRALWARVAGAPALAPPAEAAADAPPPPVLHVVAPPALAPAHAAALADLAARGVEVHAWVVLPDPAALRGGPPAHPLAREASAAARDGARRLLGLAPPGAPPVTLDVLPDPPAPPTRLGRLQAALRGAPPPGASPAPPDGTLEALACADPRRAAEVVASEVWATLRRAEAEGRPLRLSDVAVVLAGDDPDADRARLAAAFDACHRLPLVFSDAPPTRELRPIECARRLLDLPLSALGRAEVLEVLTHPCALARLRDDEDPGATAEAFEGWVEAAGVVRGLDATDQAGTYLAAADPGDPPADLHTWDQGLARLALGALVDAPDDDALLVVAGKGWAPAPLGPGARVERLLARARALLADARAARDARLPLGRWAAFLVDLVGGVVAGTDGPERGALERALAALRDLAPGGGAADGAPGAGAGGEDRAVPYRVARALAEEALLGVRPSRDHELTGGVVVGGLAALRGAPFRAAFVLGLAEGAFPAAAPHDDLDLRPDAPWDPAPRARDLAALVERVLATGERLGLVWTARDPLTNEDVPWAPAVGALARAAVEAGVVAAEEDLVRRPPARREDDPAVEVAPRGARLEAHAAEVRAALDAHLGGHGLGGAALDADHAARTPALAEALARVGAAWPALPPAGGEADEQPAGPGPVARLTLAALHDLLESPLQAWARHRLRLWRDDEAPADDVEPLAPTRLDEVVWLREALLEAVVTGSRKGDPGLDRALLAAWDARADRARRRGRGPTGPFLAAARARAARTLGAWRDALDKSPGLAHLRGLRVVRLGPAPGPAGAGPPEEARPAVALDLPGGRRVELVGRTGPRLPDGSALVLVDAARAADAQVARGVLDLAALAAAGGPEADAPGRVRVVTRQGGRVHGLRPFGADAARAWLAALAEDLLDRPHPYALPLGAAARWLRDEARGAAGLPLAAALRLGRDGRFTAWDDDHGPLPRPRRVEPPPDAEALARRRLGPWLEREERA